MNAPKKKKPCIDTFIKAYILTGLTNGKQAAIDAGYSPKTADQQASRLLKTVKVQQAVKEHQEVSMKSFIWSKERKLEILQNTIEACYRADADKGVINGAVVVSALKEHNAMQGDNAPTETNMNLINKADDEGW